MASLQARHSRSCPLYPWTTAAKAATGCTCKPGPMYHVVSRVNGKLVREAIGHNRKLAERGLTKVSYEQDEQRYLPPVNMKFSEWAEKWLTLLERPGARTINGYRETIAHANRAFGNLTVRQISGDDIGRLNTLLKTEGLSDSTRAKHLRVLSACFKSAVKRRLCIGNPVADLEGSERPKPADREADYFEDDELPRLFAAIPEGLYRTLCKTAYMTGLRLGELSALTWGAVDLSAATITVRRNFSGGELKEPKSRTSRRTVELRPEVVDLLGTWWGECGNPKGDDVLVFPGESGFMMPWAIDWRLKKAMETAGITVAGPTGEGRSFHSLRHCFAKACLESGAPLFWVSRQMGHSSYRVTEQRYGHWELHKKQSQRESRRVKFVKA
jgi:integrase